MKEENGPTPFDEIDADRHLTRMNENRYFIKYTYEYNDNTYNSGSGFMYRK